VTLHSRMYGHKGDVIRFSQLVTVRVQTLANIINFDAVSRPAINFRYINSTQNLEPVKFGRRSEAS